MNQVLFDFYDRLHLKTLNERVVRSQVISANLVNSETPGFRSIGYRFEDALMEVAQINNELSLHRTNDRHFVHRYAYENGDIKPDVYVRPTESVAEDGNTVDVDAEMVKMTQNQILYRSSLELFSKKIGLLRYALTGGR